MYKRKSQSWLKHWDFCVLDLICLWAAYFLAYCIKSGTCELFSNLLYRNVLIVITLISILVTVFFDTYKNVIRRGLYIEFIFTVKQVLIVEMLTVFYLFSVKEIENISRTIIFMLGLFYGVFSYSIRNLWKMYLKKSSTKHGKRSLIIITDQNMAEVCVKNIKKNNYQGILISGISIIDCDKKGEIIQGIPVVANKDDVMEYICREWIDEAFLELQSEKKEEQEILEQLWEMGVVTHKNLTSQKEIIGQKQFIEKLGNYTVQTTSINYATSGQLFVKRLIDLVGGLVGTVLTGILCLIVVPVIKIQSPGPVFFKQERIGKNGKRFKMYKFRTMYIDAEQKKKDLMGENRVDDPRMFKLDFDPRIIGNKILPDGTKKTGFMNLCRKLSIDEFPQFLNVLKGDMSLVGTRPPTVDEFEIYELHHKARLAIKPGITGMWQVSGRSNITDFEEVVRLDKQYITEWNIGLDIKILLKTVFTVLKQEGSM